MRGVNSLYSCNVTAKCFTSWTRFVSRARARQRRSITRCLSPPSPSPILTPFFVYIHRTKDIYSALTEANSGIVTYPWQRLLVTDLEIDPVLSR